MCACMDNNNRYQTPEEHEAILVARETTSNNRCNRHDKKKRKKKRKRKKTLHQPIPKMDKVLFRACMRRIKMLAKKVGYTQKKKEKKKRIEF